MLKRTLIGLALLAGLSFGFAPPAQALAIPQQVTQFAACDSGIADFLGLEPWYGCLVKQYGEIKITKLTDIWLVVLPVLEDLIRVAGYLAVGFIFWGGIKYVKSQGNPSETGAARDVIRNAVIGLLWVILSVTIIEFVTLGLQAGI